MIESSVPYPERRTTSPCGYDQLTSENPPTIASRYAIPAATPGFKQGVPLLQGRFAAQQLERLTCRPACVFPKHPASATILGQEDSGALSYLLLLQNRPVLKIFPGRPIATTPAFGPFRSVKWNARGCATKDEAQSLLLPGFPLLWTECFAFERVVHKTVGIRPVSPGAKLESSQTSGHRPRRTGKMMVESQQPITHGWSLTRRQLSTTPTAAK